MGSLIRSWKIKIPMNIKQQWGSHGKDIVGLIGGACLLYSTVFVAEFFLKLQPAVLEFFRFPDSSPGDSPPWYFIRIDFAHGVCALGTLLICLAIAGVGWKRFRIFAEIIVWMIIISHGGDIIKAAIIYLSCPNFLYPTAVSHWPTFDSYLNDASFSIGNDVASCAGIGLVLVFAYLRWRTKPAEEANDN